MYVPPYNNRNKPLVEVGNEAVPLTYFNIVNLKKGEKFTYKILGFETCIVPATGSISVAIDNFFVAEIGKRKSDVWDDEPEGVYAPTGSDVNFVALSETVEVFIAGAKCDEVYDPFLISSSDIDFVQYGSDDTKTHRKIKHILGQKQNGKVGRLLVSELYTVGQGGWSGFPPHKHDTDRKPTETQHDEVYNFRFKPDHGFGLQLLQQDGKKIGDAFHLINKSTVAIPSGYHPCVVAPGYEMYYFTILAGLSQRPLIQYFQPDHEWQVNIIPGIKDMIAKFK